MGTGKLIDRLRDYMDLDRHKQKDKRDKISVLLKKLNKKQRELEQMLDKEPGPGTRKRLKRDLKVLRAQRKKGIKLCRGIGCKKG